MGMLLRAYDLKQLDVLVIDDCQFMRMLLDRMLKAIGFHHVETVQDGQAAIDRILAAGQGAHDIPDLIITDWEMTPMDGASFVKLVRESNHPVASEIPMIMLTGHTDLERIIDARDVGVTEFLAKPVSAHMLYRRIIKIIDHPRPFIRSIEYSGPCRRRMEKEFKGIDKRSGLAFEI